MQWDFWTQNPETAHQVTYLMGDRGLPATWRAMNGYGSHTYAWVNAQGERFWVKYHFLNDAGFETMSSEEAEKLAGADAEYHRRDLFNAIKEGDHPTWTMYVQIMPYEDAKTYRINPFDLTKTWPKADYPRIPVGRLTLNRNPENFFAQIEQAAFSPANMVPGTGNSPDKMLLGRNFAYADAQRYRIGTNFQQLPVNRPKNPVHTYNFEGNMWFDHTGDRPVYAPNTVEGATWSDEQGPVDNGWEADGELVRSAYTLRPEDDDFGQAGILVRESSTTPSATVWWRPWPAPSGRSASRSSPTSSSTGRTSTPRSAHASRPPPRARTPRSQAPEPVISETTPSGHLPEGVVSSRLTEARPRGLRRTLEHRYQHSALSDVDPEIAQRSPMSWAASGGPWR